MCVPTAYGGAGLDYVSLGLASEELEYVDTSLRVILSVHVGLNSLTLLAWGTEDQKQRYLVPQAQGQKIATYGLTEPSAGSDARGIQTVAIRRGDRYVLTGEKMWISLADVADHFLVFAWTDLEKKRQRDPSGISAFIVERALQGLLERHADPEVGHPGRQHRVLQDGRRRGARREPGRPRRGGLQDRDVRAGPGPLDRGRRAPAAWCARAATPAWPTPGSAATFGVEIGQHQLVKEMIARMESDYQAARLLWLRAGWLKNVGRRNTREVSLAKWFATVASERAAGDAVQIHGANGYSDEYPVGRFYRNCKGAVIYEGTREIHTLMQADYLLGYRTDKPSRCELPAVE